MLEKHNLAIIKIGSGKSHQWMLTLGGILRNRTFKWSLKCLPTVGKVPLQHLHAIPIPRWDPVLEGKNAIKDILSKLTKLKYGWLYYINVNS